jgi:hypothetical protein
MESVLLIFYVFGVVLLCFVCGLLVSLVQNFSSGLGFSILECSFVLVLKKGANKLQCYFSHWSNKKNMKIPKG